MSGPLPPRDWSDLVWPDIGKADPSAWVAVLPLAAIEQHGPHLPLGTDAIIAAAYLARVRELLLADVPAVFLPLQTVGLSVEHLAFPGTLTLSTETALKVWGEIGDSIARAGVRRLVMVTSHGGNSAAMGLVAQDLRLRHQMLAVTTGWSRFGAPDGLFTPEELRHGIHGGAVETSIMLAHAPHQVATRKLADFRPASIDIQRHFDVLSTQRPAPLAWAAEDLHPSGAAGDATAATADKGRRTIEHGARAFCTLLADVAGFDLKMLDNTPSI